MACIPWQADQEFIAQRQPRLALEVGSGSGCVITFFGSLVGMFVLSYRSGLSVSILHTRVKVFPTYVQYSIAAAPLV